jgi:nitrogen regulatory protein P-II 1
LRFSARELAQYSGDVGRVRPIAGTHGRRTLASEPNGMKKVEAVVRVFKLEDVKIGLSALGVKGMTVSDVRGFGRQRGHSEMYRGTEYKLEFVPKVKIEIAVPDDSLQAVLETIMRTAQTGQIGDGKIFVSELADSIRIRTGETGEQAI